MTDTITVTGNIATDPQNRRTSSGTPVTTFRVASSQRRFDKSSGRWVDDFTNWYSVSTWRGLGEHAFQSLRKGDRIVVTGRVRIRDWEAGAKHGTTVEIDAEAIGHDLLWGTTTFQKDAPAVDQPATTESWPTAQPPTADAWAPTPADGDLGSSSVKTEEPEAPARELVGAETPY